MDLNTSVDTERPGEVKLELRGPLAIIRLGTREEKIVVLTEQRMRSLRQAVTTVRENSAVQGLLIIGASPQVFCAGADIQTIYTVNDAATGERLARMGQEIFNDIAALHCRTVAAISGACVGGGCELVLACNFRLLANTRESKIGLPEVKLGILPGFGGTQRLPRLVGIRQALDIILQGRMVSPSKALQIGLVDKVVEPPEGSRDGSGVLELLEQVGSEIATGKASIRRRKPSVSDLALTYTNIGHSLVQSRTKRSVLERTQGHYPAPLAALDVVLVGLKDGLEPGLRAEAKALGELIVTPQCKALVHVYILTESAAKLGRAGKAEVEGARIGVLGGGTMGAGIAASFVLAGHPVVLVDPIEDARKRALEHVHEVLAKQRNMSESIALESRKLLQVSETMESLTNATLVIEAVPENMALKQEVLRGVTGHVSSKAIIATNTSSLPVHEIASAIDHRERIIGMHFFNPAEKMPLVEVVLGKETNERTLALTAALVGKLGKYPVVVNEVPGFLVNRILTPYLVEAAHCLGDGVSVESVDQAATQFGMPMGPIRLLDEIGLDIAAHVFEILRKAYGTRMNSAPYLSKLVSLGRLGRKSGSGFYLFEGESCRVDPVLPSLLGLPAPKNESTDVDELIDRLILPMVNEAIRCLDEGVAGTPGPEAGGQIDLATVMGTGFAPFRGGIIYYAEALGARSLQEKLTVLASRYGERFTPCEGINERARLSQSFYAVRNTQ